MIKQKQTTLYIYLFLRLMTVSLNRKPELIEEKTKSITFRKQDVKITNQKGQQFSKRLQAAKHEKTISKIF